jgi:hypothetical protein
MITPPRYSSGWESGSGPADPALSNVNTGIYSGTGYAASATGKVGTINAGTNMTATQPGLPAQVRFFAGADGNLYALDNVTNITFNVGPPATPGIAPPVYSPTTTAAEPKPTNPGAHYGELSPLGQWFWNGSGLPQDDWIQVAYASTK